MAGSQPSGNRQHGASNSGMDRHFPPLLAFLNILVYVLVWNLSLVSLLYPFALLYALYHGHNLIVVFILVILAVCYYPYPEGSFPLGGKRVRKIASYWAGQYFRSWTLTFEQDESDEETPTLYGFHPHGIFSQTWGSCFCHRNFDTVSFCFSDLLKFSPLFRLYTTTLGKPSGVSKPVIEKLMRSKRSLAIIIGGFEEASLTSSEQERVYVKSRFGFVKLALQHGYCLRAVYGMGEHKMYWNMQHFMNFRVNVLNKYGLPGVLPLGWNVFLPFMPDPNVDLNVLVSKKLQLPKIESPSKADVEKWHKAYVDMLVDMHKRNKKYGELEVW